MRLSAGCKISFEASTPTPVILMLRPRSGYGQWIVSEAYLLTPSIPVIEYTDGYGNLCQRMVIPPGQFQVKSTACVETADAIDVQPGAPYVLVENLPESVLQFLLPSRYCQSDHPQLSQLAIDITRNAAPGYNQAEAIRSWIHQSIEYQYGSSDASTAALDTANSRKGVCRDFTHLGIALCRSLNIPARMVVGYLYQLDPMDLHAWFEAYVGDRWYTFDATQDQPRGNRITIAYGRDAADVALSTQFGVMKLLDMQVWVEEEQKEEKNKE
ncbi:transglutaminase family protein [Phormidium tenue FACHB-886]|nr:transglutaminase family protein [Phormidium tenue FACHB-886]